MGLASRDIGMSVTREEELADVAKDASGPVPAPNALLVAVDFSPASLRALDVALGWRGAGADVTVLHVVDTALAARVHDLAICSLAEATTRQRARAERELAALAKRGRFEPMIVEGEPFTEIIKVAADLECDLIVVGIRGVGRGLDRLLFGSTAEKILRGASQAVLCIP
jgi:nucleotide-binding universal stress UspA family protein